MISTPLTRSGSFPLVAVQTVLSFLISCPRVWTWPPSFGNMGSGITPLSRLTVEWLFKWCDPAEHSGGRPSWLLAEIVAAICFVIYEIYEHNGGKQQISDQPDELHKYELLETSFHTELWSCATDSCSLGFAFDWLRTRSSDELSIYSIRYSIFSLKYKMINFIIYALCSVTAGKILFIFLCNSVKIGSYLLSRVWLERWWTAKGQRRY